MHIHVRVDGLDDSYLWGFLTIHTDNKFKGNLTDSPVWNTGETGDIYKISPNCDIV